MLYGFLTTPPKVKSQVKVSTNPEAEGNGEAKFNILLEGEILSSGFDAPGVDKIMLGVEVGLGISSKTSSNTSMSSSPGSSPPIIT